MDTTDLSVEHVKAMVYNTLHDGNAAMFDRQFHAPRIHQIYPFRRHRPASPALTDVPPWLCDRPAAGLT